MLPSGTSRSIHRMESGATQRLDRTLNQGDGLFRLALSVLQRSGVVVGQELGVVLGPAQRVDPFGRAAVAFGAAGARDLTICDLLQQLVGEGVLDVGWPPTSGGPAGRTACAPDHAEARRHQAGKGRQSPRVHRARTPCQ